MDTIFRTVFTTPDGRSGTVPDSPLPEWQDALAAGPGQWRAMLPRAWSAAGVPGDARGSDDLVLSLVGGTVWRCYALSDSTAQLSGGAVFGDWTWGSSTWGDPPAGSGQLVYQGQLEEIAPNIGASAEYIEALIMPPASSLADTSTAAPFTFTEEDPVLIAKSFFDLGLVPNLTWDPRNVLSGRTITQTYAIQPLRQTLDFCTTAAGSGWVNHIDERGRFRLWKPDTTKADHVVEVGREVIAAAYTITRQPQKNRIIVNYKNSGSVISKAAGWTQAETRDGVYNFPEITDAPTAQLVADSLLVTLNTLTLHARLTLVQQSGALWLSGITLLPGQGGGVFIPATGAVVSAQQRGCVSFSIRPGDTLQLWLDSGDPAAFTWGDGAWGQARWTGGQVGVLQSPQIVHAVTYHGADTLEVDLATARPNIVAAHTKIATYVERALANLAGA